MCLSCNFLFFFAHLRPCVTLSQLSSKLHLIHLYNLTQASNLRNSWRKSAQPTSPSTQEKPPPTPPRPALLNKSKVRELATKSNINVNSNANTNVSCSTLVTPPMSIKSGAGSTTRNGRSSNLSKDISSTSDSDECDDRYYHNLSEIRQYSQLAPHTRCRSSSSCVALAGKCVCEYGCVCEDGCPFRDTLIVFLVTKSIYFVPNAHQRPKRH